MGLGGIGNYLGWTAFVGGSLAMAALLWRRRMPDAASPTRGWLTYLLPTMILAGLLAGAWWEDRGSRLSAAIDRFSIPVVATPESGDGVLLFRIADRVTDGDLVVQPYLQDYLNRITLADPPRHLVEVYGNRVNGSALAMEARVVLTDYPGDAADERPAMLVVLGEGEPGSQPVLRRSHPLQPGESMRLRIYRQDLSVDTDADDAGFQARRSLIIVNRAPHDGLPGSIEILPEQPLLSDAGNCRTPRDVLVAAPIEGAPTLGYRQPRNLEFSGLGLGGHPLAVMGQGAVGPLADGTVSCMADMPPLLWPSADSGERTALRVTYTAVGLPWFLVLLLGAASAVCLVLGGQAGGAERLLAPFLLYLLAMRTLVAIAAAYYDPQEAPVGFYADAANAIVFMPPLLAAMIRPDTDPDGPEWRIWLAAMLALGATAVLWLYPHVPDRRDLALPGLAVVLVGLRIWFRGRNVMAGLGDRLVTGLVRERRTLGLHRVFEWFSRMLICLRLTVLQRVIDPVLSNSLLRNGVSLLLLAATLRLFLWGLSNFTSSSLKERLWILPLSIPYLLALFFGTAMAVIAIKRGGFSRSNAALSLCLGLFAALGALVLVKDTGFVLVHLLPICAVAAWHLGSADQRHAAHLVPATIVMLPVAFIVAGLAYYAWNAANSLALLESWQGQTAHLAERMALALDINANSLRLVQLFAPQSVELVGTRAAYEQMSQTAMMHALGSTMAGHGWLQPVELLSIRKEQTWDYVAAVHLMYPFGRIGALAFLAVIAAAACAVLANQAEPGSDHDDEADEPHEEVAVEAGTNRAVLTLVGQQAACTLLFSAVYLVLGNLLLVPFTGRSIYMISVMSWGEVMEGMLLLCLAALAWHRGRA